jgi:hypothetical protein
VVVRIAAFTKDGCIFLVVPVRIENAVRRVEMFFPEDRYFFFVPAHKQTFNLY